jgi:hypothetical protein
MMKITAKRDETVMLDDPRVGIGIDTVPEYGEFNYDEIFEAGDPPETAATASTATEIKFWQLFVVPIKQIIS